MKKEYLQDIVGHFGYLINRVDPDFDWVRDVCNVAGPLDWAEWCRGVADLEEEVMSYKKYGFSDCFGEPPPENLVDNMLGTISQHAQDELDKS